MLAVDLCKPECLLCKVFLLCHMINVAAIFIIPGRDHGASCKFPARANQHCGLSVHSNETISEYPPPPPDSLPDWAVTILCKQLICAFEQSAKCKIQNTNKEKNPLIIQNDILRKLASTILK